LLEELVAQRGKQYQGSEKQHMVYRLTGLKLNIRGVTAKFVGSVKEYSKSDLNNWSVVLHVTYNKNKFLFTGDAV
jgi:beta-lactamase superfamily II metal-dependent hydrolase